MLFLYKDIGEFENTLSYKISADKIFGRQNFSVDKIFGSKPNFVR